MSRANVLKLMMYCEGLCKPKDKRTRYNDFNNWANGLIRAIKSKDGRKINKYLGNNCWEGL